MSKRFLSSAILLIVWAIGLLLHSSRTDLLESLEYKVWDFRVSLTADATRADKSIKVINISQDSLDYFEKEYGLTWPLPRQIYSHVISYLTRAGAKGLAIDILFTESSVQGVESDREFAKSTGGVLPVISSVVLQSRSQAVSEDKFSIFSLRQKELPIPDSLRNEARIFYSITLPIKELLDNSTAFGNVQAEPDTDGVYRRLSPIGFIKNVPVLSLPLSLFYASNKRLPIVEPKDQIIRLHGGSEAYQSFALEDITHSEVSLIEGKEPLISPSEFKDCWVILGTSAPGLLDLRPTSIDEKLGGLYFNAAALDNIINDDFIKIIPLSQSAIINLLLILLALLATITGSRVSYHIARVTAILALYWLISIYFAQIGLWLPVVIPTISIMATAFLGIALQYNLEGRQHKFIRNAFKFYVSPTVVEKIVAAPESLSLGGEKREISVFFSDIVGFTSISERLEPTILVKMLNEYLSLITQIIQKSGGTVDKFVGDAVMAFWNAPLDIVDHGDKAVQAAIKCQTTLQENREHFQKKYGVFPDTRIGINTDTVNVGNFGSQERFNYTVIGDGVNLASRLEGANKNFGTRILFTEQTKESLSPQTRYRFVAELVVLGKTRPIKVYEPLYGQSYDTEKSLADFEIALNALNEHKRIEAISALNFSSEDPVSISYLNKLKNNPDHEDYLKWELTDK